MKSLIMTSGSFNRLKTREVNMLKDIDIKITLDRFALQVFRKLFNTIPVRNISMAYFELLKAFDIAKSTKTAVPDFNTVLETVISLKTYIYGIEKEPAELILSGEEVCILVLLIDAVIKREQISGHSDTLYCLRLRGVCKYLSD